MSLTFSYGDLKKIIAESSNEFKAKLGPNVESDDKKNNGKAYDEAKKRAKDYDGGLNKEVGEDRPKYVKVDDNRTTLGYEVDNAGDDYKKRVKAQVHGYTSELEEENDIEKTGDFSDNPNIYNGIRDGEKEIQKGRKIAKQSGLTASKCPPSTFEHGNMFTNESKEGFDMRKSIDALSEKTNIPVPVVNENKSIKTVYFKKTEFLTEEHMMSRIPDEFKKDGEQFKMKDKKGEEYLVEWKEGKGTVISHEYKEGHKNEMNRMKKLWEYKTSDTKTTQRYRAEEGDGELKNMIDLMRKIK